jgi:hypothetical protein
MKKSQDARTSAAKVVSNLKTCFPKCAEPCQQVGSERAEIIWKLRDSLLHKWKQPMM